MHQSNMKTLSQTVAFGLLAQLTFGALFIAAAPSGHSSAAAMTVALDSPTLKMISDDDLASMQQIKLHIANEHSEFKNIDEVIAFLEKVRVLAQKHPKNIAFAQGDLKELLKLLSLESVTKLIRFDTDPFYPIPFGDDKMAYAQRALDEDELARKLFGGPIRSLIESRKQTASRTEDGNHKDGNFFTNFWCKLSGGCPHQ